MANSERKGIHNLKRVVMIGKNREDQLRKLDVFKHLKGQCVWFFNE